MSNDGFDFFEVDAGPLALEYIKAGCPQGPSWEGFVEFMRCWFVEKTGIVPVGAFGIDGAGGITEAYVKPGYEQRVPQAAEAPPVDGRGWLAEANLAEVFVALTGVKGPTPGTYPPKVLAEDWMLPLRRILDACEGDIGQAGGLLAYSVRSAQVAQQNVTSPKSILGNALALSVRATG